MAASLSGVYNLQSFSDLGALAAGFRLYTYAAGTTTQKTAYTDQAGTVPHTYTSDGGGGLYIALNSRGELPAPLFLTSGGYDIALKTPAGSTVWTRRAIGADDNSSTLRTDLANAASSSAGASLVAYDPTQAYGSGVGLYLNYLFARTAAEIAAGVTPTNYQYPPCNVFRYGAKGDYNGTTGTDDTAAIQAAINVAKYTNDPGTYGSFSPYRGAAVVFFPAGAYKVTAALTISTRCTLMGEGASEFSSGTRLIQFTANTDLIVVDAVASGTSFSIENMTLESLPALVGGTGNLLNVKRTFSYTNSQVYRQVTFANPQNLCAKLIGDDILIEGGRIDVARKGIQLGTTTAAESASNVRIIGFDFFQIGNGGAGAWVEMHNVVNVTISASQGQTVSGLLALAVVDAKTTTPYQVSNVSIQGCTFKNARTLILASGISGLNIADNTIDSFGAGAGEANSVIDLFGVCQNVVITGNSIKSTQDTANFYKDASSTSVTNLVISGNNFVNAGGSGDAINCTKAVNARIFPNTFSGFSRDITSSATLGYLALGLPLNALVNVTYSASMQFDASLGGSFRITATNNTAFTIQDPINGSSGQRIRVTIRNTSGGALGALTFGGSYKLGAAWTQPANGFSRSIEFENDGTNWVERGRTAADVAN